MKKSELKSLIKKIVTETRRLRSESFSGDAAIDQLNLDSPPDMGDEKHPRGGAHPGATPPDDEIDLDAGYDRNDPKHPTWADRMADKVDFARDAERDSMFEDKKLGVSTMKKSPDKKENTQMGYEDKTITSTDKPTEKKEGKKLPIIQKKSNTETDHRADKGSTPTPPAGEKKEGKALPVGGHGAKGLKEEILKMVRESIEEMARTKGALGKNNPNRTAPLKNTGANYIKAGTTTPEAPDAAANIDTSKAATERTNVAVEALVQYNMEIKFPEVMETLTPMHSDETPYNLSRDAVQRAMEKAKSDIKADREEPVGPPEAELNVPARPVDKGLSKKFADWRSKKVSGTHPKV